MAAPQRASDDATQLVEQVLERAVQQQASDIHLEPKADGYDLLYRIDGLLTPVESFDAPTGRAAVIRLMVLAQLLTYRRDVPQEGRLTVALPGGEHALELRLAVMPTTHGQRAVVRLPAELTQPRQLDALNLPPRVFDGLKRFADTDAGMLLLTGPAGSGKTTTIYALLEYIAARHRGLSIISLEDPVERNLEAVTQIEVTPFGEMTYERALRSILRQDPDVIMVGEIRDRDTASVAVQATLSGHRLICTMHAGTPGSAIARLIEMGIEPYQLNSAVFAIVTMRLLRKRSADGEYHGRIPVGELAMIDQPTRSAILDRVDSPTLQHILSKQDGYKTLRQTAVDLVTRGLTDNREVQRVLGDDPCGAGHG